MTGYYLQRPDTAFSISRQKRPREKKPDHLAWLKTLPCVVCGKRPVDPAHLRSGNRTFGKPETGMGERPADKWAVPLCRTHHDEQHSENELAWWAKQNIDPFMLALSLYGASGDDEAAAQILSEARK